MNSQLSYKILLSTTFMGTVTAGLFWTGFPIYLTSLLKYSLSLSSIYAWATLGSLIFSLIGGIWADKSDFRKLSIISQLLSGIIILSIPSLIGLSEKLIYFFLPVLYFNLALGVICESVWIMRIPISAHLKSRVLNRSMLTILAKLSAFSLGPTIFTSFGEQALYLCGAICLFISATQGIIIGLSKDVFHTMKAYALESRTPLREYSSLIKLPNFSLAILLTGLLSVPINPLFATQVMRFGTTLDTSMFWGITGFGSLLGIMILRRINLQEKTNLYYAFTLLMIATVGVAFSSSTPLKIILASAIYVFCSTTFSTQLNIEMTLTSKPSEFGYRFGIFTALMELGVFFGMCAGDIILKQNYNYLIIILAILLILRLIFILRLPYKQLNSSK